MYLKRLDLHGFKSFAGRTRFEFAPGITAIVGPNGSGKSNIADALRWVLGEQSSRLLRARKLDDILYAGSTKRSRSDRVEVSITLDNGDGWLPLDATEVSLSRRGSRSGDSDYIINGKRTRLRGLQDLLMRATASQSSYAIIGQGLVESVLNLRAEERRQLIEEAADIQRYRLKIDEVRERLKGTHENVERVKLLMSEIAPRLSQLERQARRADEHSRLSKKLTQTLGVYYEQQWHRAHESLTVARASCDQAQAEFLQAKVGRETCERELAEITAQLDEYREAAAATMAERERLEQRITELDRALAVAGDRRAILQSRESELQEELTAVEAEHNRVKGLLAQEESRAAAILQPGRAARARLETRQKELAALERELGEARGQASEAEAKAGRLEGAAAEVNGRSARLADSQALLKKEESQAETRRRSLIKQMFEQLRLLRGHRAQELQLLTEVSEVTARRHVLEIEVGEVRKRLGAVEAVQNERRGKLEVLRARLSMLEDAQRQITATGDEGPILLEGALATVYETIRVPRGLEEAIAAALDDRLEAFIFPRQSEAVSAVQSLVNQGGPRAVVLPLDAMKQVYPLNLMKERGVLGVAARLIKYPPQFEKLIDSLLGRTIVVQDTATAARLIKRGLGTVATLEGIVFHPAGHVSGGQARAKRPFVLSYERDMESIPKEIERIERSLAITEREAAALRDRLVAAEGALASLNGEAEQALGHRRAILDSLSQRQQRLAQLRGEMRALMASLAGDRERRQAAAAEIESLGTEHRRLQAEAKESLKTAGFLERAASLIKDRVDAAQCAANESAQEVAQGDAEQRSLVIQRESAEAALSRLEAQASAKAEQLRGLEMELSTLDAGVQSQEKQIAQERAHLQAFLERVTPGHDGVHHLEARQRDLHSQVLGGQSRMIEAERQVLASEAEVRRWQSEIESLSTKMTDDGMRLSSGGTVVSLEKVEARIPIWLAAESQEEGPGGMRPISGGAEVDPDGLAAEIQRLRAQIRGLGTVNVEALGDYESIRERHDFLAGQVRDLDGAEQALKRAMEELTKLMRRRFESTFEQVAHGFERNFHAFFGEGGHARLLPSSKDPATSGVDIEARPPGKRTQNLAQLSGGEKALTAVSLLFALLQVNPSPFCVLDEVDAMLDETNVARFANALRELSRRTQFIVITHNRRTIEIADSIYGISMAADAISRVLSMRLADVPALDSPPAVN